MAEAIELEAPVSVIQEGGIGSYTAKVDVPSTTPAIFDVAVGGVKDDYTQVEQSAKVGSITWVVGAYQGTSAKTAPDNDYLEEPGIPE